MNVKTRTTITTTRTVSLDEDQILTIVRAYVAQHLGVPDSQLSGRVYADSYERCLGVFTHTVCAE